MTQKLQNSTMCIYKFATLKICIDTLFLIQIFIIYLNNKI